MIDVHSPEHRISGKRDFFLHLFTITIGLLIALGLENAAEAWHHREQRNAAEATIRREISDNRTAVTGARRTLLVERQDLLNLLQYLEQRSAGKTADAHGLSLRYESEPYGTSAWRTASATGVLNYMQYDRVQGYAAAYQLQEQYDAMERETMEEYLELDSYFVNGFNADTLTLTTVNAAIPDVRKTLAHLQGELDVTRGLLEAYGDALKQ